MDNQVNHHGRRRFFYGWVVVASCLLILAALYGIRYSFGVFFKSLETEFGWTRARTSAPFSFYMLLAPLFAILGGWASDKYGPKVVVLGMGLLSGLSFFLTMRAGSLLEIYVSYSLLLAVGTGPAYSVVMSTGSRWFQKSRATALGIIGTGASCGTVVIAPVTAWLISRSGWRIACLGIGIIALAFVVPSGLLLKKEPKDIGAQRDGKPISPADNKDCPEDLVGFSLKAALKTQNFWLFFMIWLAYSFCLHSIMSHLVPRVEDLGISPIKAASVLSLLSGISIPSRVLVGHLADRLDKKLVIMFLAALHTVAMLWLICCTRMWMFYLFALVYGVAYGGIDSPITALIAEIFGLAKAGAIMGALGLGWGFGAALSPYVSGIIFDIYDSYHPAFLSGGLIMLLAAGSALKLNYPRKG